METWLALVLASSVFAAISAYFDNYLTDNYFKERTPHAQKCFYGPAYAVIAILILVFYPYFFHVDPFAISTALLLFLAGVISSIASIPYYSALESENTTGAAIFFQLSPIFYLTLGALLLSERITGTHLIAFLILLAAPMIIILSTRKRGKKLEYRAAFFLLLYIIIYSFSQIVFVIAERDSGASGSSVPIAMAIAFMFAGKGCCDIILSIFIKKWRMRYRHILKKSKWKVLAPLLANTTIWIFVEFFYRGAMVSGQVAIVSAVGTATQLIATFLLGLLFTIIWPSFGREKLDKRSVVVHLIATVVAVAGIVLIESPGLFGG